MPPEFLPPTTERNSHNLAEEDTNGKTLRGSRVFAWQTASNLFISLKYAWAGLNYAFRTQRNFRIHLIVGSLAIGLSVLLRLSPTEISIIGLTIGAVLTMELLNTAIESIVDLSVKQTYHDLAKIAKDCAAGAVLTSSLAAILVAGFLLLPPLLRVAHLNLFR